MAGQNSFCQRRAAARQTNNENRRLVALAGIRPASTIDQPVRITDLDDLVDDVDIGLYVVVTNGCGGVSCHLVVMERFIPAFEIFEFLTQRIVNVDVLFRWQLFFCNHRHHLLNMRAVFGSAESRYFIVKALVFRCFVQQ